MNAIPIEERRSKNTFSVEIGGEKFRVKKKIQIERVLSDTYLVIFSSQNLIISVVEFNETLYSEYESKVQSKHKHSGWEIFLVIF